MKKKSLISHVYPSYLLVAVVAIMAVALYASLTISRFYYSQTKGELTSAARISAEHFRGVPGTNADGLSDAADSFCKAVGRDSGYRLTVMLPSGKVIGDSDENPAVMENHGDRPEIRDAIAFGVGITNRFSHTIGKRMMYVAVPVVVEGGRTAGVVRTSFSLAAIDRTLGVMWHRIAMSGVVIAVLAVVVSLLVSRRITRPLDEIRNAAEAIGRGNMAERLRPSGLAEIDILAEALNRMMDQLNERISIVTQQRDEQNALFSCMAESVLAVDAEKRVIKMNTAAMELFRADASVLGRNVMEVVRNNDLLDVVTRALESSETVEGDVSLQPGDRYLHAHGTVLNGANGLRIGALIVLYDVTRLRKLEVVRRDFVANVSHELKTPVTSIKGFVETLLDGAMKDPVGAEKFLKIVLRQADRLAAIIDDLLVLSSLEQEKDANTVVLEQGHIAGVLRDAIEVCSVKAGEKMVKINLDCSEQLTARINPALLEQAMVNLIDNAVKYSGEETTVDVRASKTGDKVVIEVKDRGPGIEKIHLSRIFERFYTVDKARSRQLGGTGLGLSIVKHIALAHKGDVSVDSVPGQGSTFSIYLLP